MAFSLWTTSQAPNSVLKTMEFLQDTKHMSRCNQSQEMELVPNYKWSPLGADLTTRP